MLARFVGMLRRRWLRLSYVLLVAAFVALCVSAYSRLTPDRMRETPQHVRGAAP